MFPFDIDDEEIDPVIEEDKTPSDYEIDLNTGRLTGHIISGLDAVKQWAYIVLLTERYFYPQYTWDHGSELQTLIGQNYDEDYIQSEVQRMIEDALMVSDDVLGIDDVICIMDKDKLTVTFTINTVYGRGEMSV